MEVRMTTDLPTFAEILPWLKGAPTPKGGRTQLQLVLGNGFSIAYDATKFSYSGLLQQAELDGLVGPNSSSRSCRTALTLSNLWTPSASHVRSTCCGKKRQT
jgi:hypothetical protein